MSRGVFVTYALDDQGEPIPSPTVNVYDPGTTNHIAQTIYAANTGGTTKTNPFTAAADGRVELYLDEGAAVDLLITKTSYDPTTVGAVINPPLEFGDESDIADIGTTEDAGDAVTLPRSNHVHAHPVITTGGLHTDYMLTAAHTLTLHNSLDITPGAHASSHEPGGSDEVSGSGGGGGTGFSASFAYYVYKSGSTYYAVRTIDNTIISSGASVHTPINAAASALTHGGGILMQDNAHTATSSILLTNGARLFGSRTNTDGDGSYPLISAGGSLTGPLVQLGDFNCGIFGLGLDGNTRANNTVRVFTQAGWLQYLMVMGGTQRCVYFDPATSGGPARGRMAHIRAKGIATQSVGVIEMNSSDHIALDITCTGVGSGANAMIINGQNGMYSSMHITGDSGSSDTMLVAGNDNQFSSVLLDTCGSASTAGLMVRANYNKFSSFGVMNCASGLTRPAIAIKLASAGGNCYGNEFHGVSTVDGAQNQNWTGVLKFLTSAGANPANLAAFRGTRLYGSGGATNAISAGNFTNMTISALDHIDFRFYSSTTNSGQYVMAT